MQPSRIRILAADTAPMHPPLWGGPRRVWGLLSHLPADRFEIEYVGIDESAPFGGIASRPAENITQTLFPLPPRIRAHWYPVQDRLVPGLACDIFRLTLAGRIPHFRERLASARADVFISHHPWAAAAFRPRPETVVIYDAHNCEYSLMRSLAAGKALGPAVSQWVRRVERRAARVADAVVATREKDARALCDLYGISPAKTLVVENGVRVPPPAFSGEKQRVRAGMEPETGPAVLFVGAHYIPNNEAARFIVNELAPALPGCLFWIAGSVAEALEGAALPDNVRVLGPVPDETLDRLLLAADLAVNPVEKGSGVNIKMLDYMAHGLPVVTTPFGARGLGLEDGRHARVAELSGFATALENLASDKEARERLSRHGRSVAEAHDWRVLVPRFRDLLLDLTAGKQPFAGAA